MPAKGVWVKHDRAVVEVFHIDVKCVDNCDTASCMQGGLPSYTGRYLDGALAGLLGEEEKKIACVCVCVCVCVPAISTHLFLSSFLLLTFEK